MSFFLNYAYRIQWKCSLIFDFYSYIFLESTRVEFSIPMSTQSYTPEENKVVPINWFSCPGVGTFVGLNILKISIQI